jgi:hypothetical protein
LLLCIQSWGVKGFALRESQEANPAALSATLGSNEVSTTHIPQAVN